MLPRRLKGMGQSLASERGAVVVLLLFALVNNLLWSAIVPFEGFPYGAPDERHHFEVPHYIFTQHRYPVFGPDRDLYVRVPAGEPDDLDHRVFGWYATNSWGAYLCGAATMFALGWTPLAGTIYSARLSSVVMGVLVVYLAYLIARQLFPSRVDLRLGVPWLVAFIPQVTFVSAYLGPDMFSILCTTLVLAVWIRGMQDGFSRRTSLLLGLTLGLSALARLNCWIVVYSFSLVLLLLAWVDDRRHARLFVRLALAFLIPAAVFGVWFAYNTATYGDPLAKQVFDQAWLQYFAHLIPYAQRGYSPLSFLTGSPWMNLTFVSFWCQLGYMRVALSPWYYSVILGFCVASVLGLGLGLFRRVRGGEPLWRSWRVRALVLFALIGVLLVGASFYNSFYQDFQAQGRYLFPALVPISTLLVLGLAEAATGHWGRRLVWLAAGSWLAFLQVTSLGIYLVGMIVLHI